MKRSLRTLTLVAVAAAVLGACGGGGSNEEADVDKAPSTTVIEHASSTTIEDDAPVADNEVGLQPVADLVATAHSEIAVFAAIGDEAPVSTLPATTEFGSPTTLRVVAWEGDDGEWLDVLLPVRPNGSRGFVRAGDVDLARVEYAIDVDLTTRVLNMVDKTGATVLSTPIATGSPENPTPLGSFYVTDVLDTNDDGGAYGPFALGLSAHSETLSEFGGGDGQVGIHGTNQPTSIGQNVSHGCVRVPNDIVTQLASMVPLGTPVTIH
jgi:lipoprotein-anchoring transpeptidase ErfK/SrfK